MPKIENIRFFCIQLSNYECCQDIWFYSTDSSITNVTFNQFCQHHLEEAAEVVYNNELLQEFHRYIGWEEVIPALVKILTEKHDLHLVEGYIQQYTGSILFSRFSHKQDKLLGQWAEKFYTHNDQIQNELYKKVAEDMSRLTLENEESIVNDEE